MATAARIAIFAALGLGCRPAATATATAMATATTTPTPTPTTTTTTTTTTTAEATGEAGIQGEGMGGVTVGRPLSADQIVADRYALRLHADGQPLEGFWVGEPPVFAALADGPFHRWLATAPEPGEPPASSLAEAAVTDARAGVPVELVYTEVPGLATAYGVGVGTRFADFSAVHAQAAVRPFPPLFEEPTCLATPAELPGVAFFFDECRPDAPPPPHAAVIRVAVRAAAP